MPLQVDAELPNEVMASLALLLGAVPGYIAYRLTSRFENISVSTLAPLSFITYIALFGVTKSCFDAMGSKVWIGVLICVALWAAALVLRESSRSLSERISFFGAAIALAVAVWIVSLPLAALVGFIISLVWIADYELAFGIYSFSTLTSVFAAPLWEHLFRLAMSMRPKSDTED